IDSEPIYRGGTCFQVGDAPGGRGAFQPDRCLAVRRPGLPVVMIMGDSHAAHLWPGFSTMQDRINVLQATRSGCKPVLVASPRNA
ncbi:SGNH hydrolase domain-containing protein, partial [Enterococcus faecalis]|uniref:SGNH hydrolase domain-containing protein n=1 Tax=Enterococcus faecalis TaxID=1351 RepID=UPI00403F34E9